MAIQHRITHHLEPERARRAARRAVESYATRFANYSPQVRWDTEDRATVQFSAKRVSLEGTLWLEPGAIVFELKVPLLLRPLAGRATHVLEREVGRWVAEAERGEHD